MYRCFVAMFGLARSELMLAHALLYLIEDPKTLDNAAAPISLALDELSFKLWPITSDTLMPLGMYFAAICIGTARHSFVETRRHYLCTAKCKRAVNLPIDICD